jgi:hypothetical protein
MMKMAQIEPSREWLVRYVLGELSEDETRRADERFFSDETFASMLDETYRDLVDAHSSNEIAGSEKERVERAFFSEPHRAHQLKVLQALRSLPQKAARLAPRASGPWFLSFWPVAVSVAVLSLAIVAVVYRHHEKLQARANQNAATEHVAENPPTVSPAPPVILAPTENLYTILLLPGVSRGEEAGKIFAMPSSATEIVFQAVLPGNQAGAVFEARLKGGQRDARVFPDLEARTIDTQKYVEFRVPSGDVPAGNYVVEVVDRAAPERPLEHFVVRVTRIPASRE